MIEQIDIEILVPPTFPEKYYDSLIRAAELCKVKKHLEQPPRFHVTTGVADLAY
jgi:ribosomal protein S12 methylthiotransferase accessory factor